MIQGIFTFLVFLPALVSTASPVLSQPYEDLAKIVKEQAEKIKGLEERLNKLEKKQHDSLTSSKIIPQAVVSDITRQGTSMAPSAQSSTATLWKGAPEFKSENKEYSFKIRGRLQVDAVAFKESEGGQDFNDGMAFRRARIGVTGTLTQDFKYQVLVDFADGKRIKLDDTYIQYQGWNEVTQITIGQHKVYHSLVSATSDIYVPFMERSMVSNAFEVGAGGKLGVSAFASGHNWTFHTGLMTDSADKTRLNDDGWGINSRATFAPLQNGDRILHLGASAYYREESEGSVRFADRPEIRVDNTKLIDSGTIPATSYVVAGAEMAGVWGPFSLQAEYNRADVNTKGMPNRSFWGSYVAATFFLTGEHRTYSGNKGAFGRVIPIKSIRDNGGPGAIQLAARYSYLDLADRGIGNVMKNLTLGINWITTDHTRFQFNYIHFNVVGGTEDKGHAFGIRAQTDW